MGLRAEFFVRDIAYRHDEITAPYDVIDMSGAGPHQGQATSVRDGDGEGVHGAAGWVPAKTVGTGLRCARNAAASGERAELRVHTNTTLDAIRKPTGTRSARAWARSHR